MVANMPRRRSPGFTRRECQAQSPFSTVASTARWSATNEVRIAQARAFGLSTRRPHQRDGLVADDHDGTGVANLVVECQLVARADVLALPIDVGGADVDEPSDLDRELDGSPVPIDDDRSAITRRSGPDRDRCRQRWIHLQHGHIQDRIEVHDGRSGGAVCCADLDLRGAGDDMGHGGDLAWRHHQPGAVDLGLLAAVGNHLHGGVGEVQRRHRRSRARWRAVRATRHRKQTADDNVKGATLQVHGEVRQSWLINRTRYDRGPRDHNTEA